MQHLVIIGNGIAGITTARHVRKMSNMKITVISSETKHFFSRTALMYAYMGHMRFKEIKPYEDWFWSKNNIELIYARVNSIDTDNKTLQLDNNETISYDKLVISTGSKTNKFGWPGQDLPGVQGLYSWQDVELLEENTKNISHAVIVGGGFHGKSTLLHALEHGPYNHIPGDGREKVVSNETAVKIRAEDGRVISRVNIIKVINCICRGSSEINLRV